MPIQLYVSCIHRVTIVLRLQEIGYTHMKIADGVDSLLQMAGMLARLCQKSAVAQDTTS